MKPNVLWQFPNVKIFTLGNLKKYREKIEDKLMFKFSNSFLSRYKVYYKSDKKGKEEKHNVVAGFINPELGS